VKTYTEMHEMLQIAYRDKALSRTQTLLMVYAFSRGQRGCER
jgi:hypothetical protein